MIEGLKIRGIKYLNVETSLLSAPLSKFLATHLRTRQGLPGFSRGVPLWWGVQGCVRCVLLKKNHIVSHITFVNSF